MFKMENKRFLYPHLFPLLCLATGVVLASLCLSAGNKPGFMEDYALVRVDMTELGNNLFTPSNDTASEDKAAEEEEDNEDPAKEDEEDDSILPFVRRDITDDISDSVDKAKDKAKDKVKEKVGEIGNEFVDGLAEDLGIKGWYSLHVITSCQGEFKNETAEGDNRGLEVSECSSYFTKGKFNLTGMVGSDSLSVGPIDIPIPSGIDRQLARLYGVLNGVVYLYSFSVGFTVLAMISNIIVVAYPRFYPSYVFKVTAALCGSAALLLLLASAVTTIGTTAATDALRDLGESVGVRIIKDFKFVTLTWAAFGIVSAATMFWFWQLLEAKRARLENYKTEIKRLRKEKSDLILESKKQHGRREHDAMAAYWDSA